MPKALKYLLVPYCPPQCWSCSFPRIYVIFMFLCFHAIMSENLKNLLKKLIEFFFSQFDVLLPAFNDQWNLLRTIRKNAIICVFSVFVGAFCIKCEYFGFFSELIWSFGKFALAFCSKNRFWHNKNVKMKLVGNLVIIHWLFYCKNQSIMSRWIAAELNSKIRWIVNDNECSERFYYLLSLLSCGFSHFSGFGRPFLMNKWAKY